ncbi:Hypothetical protein IALB_3110 [Ignavibacterium album JCM 16511]|uniref:TIGR02453 family protein n=1 Tax=Ignavibacterium album (strain DSM 19864 / JCM 16511 / NBRC 101810 / Mat9-16) TaxID=945713 RepID=I0APA6_IGNAJ|nr:DUF2461 domain-containing protein [Ignavibacterium album]AFH50813.1 Hypothetical protein IALB_3110 [Ignavibacterium album JCM 16511]
MKAMAFPFVTAKYLSDLSKNNNREWFLKNRERFDMEFLQPAIQFVIDIGERIQTFAPNIMAVPRVDKSIFRLHRDVRFRKNKAPYKTNLGLYFWEGKGKRMECSGFYFHIEPNNFFLGAGMYVFTPQQIKKYRDTVYNSDKGKELSGIISSIMKNKNYSIGGKTFKKTPRGYDSDYKYSELLLHSGVYSFYEIESLNMFHKKDILEFTYNVFKDMNPLHQWLVKNI